MGKKFPKAADMLALSWSPELSDLAIAWANNCDFERDEAKNRLFKEYENIALNIYIKNSTEFPTDSRRIIDEAVQTWFMQGHKFDAKKLIMPKENSATKEFANMIVAQSDKVYITQPFMRNLLYFCWSDPGAGAGTSISYATRKRNFLRNHAICYFWTITQPI